MFYIIPYTAFNIKSLQKKGVILERVVGSVNVVQSLSLTKIESDKDFEGVLENNGFKLRRNMKFGYSAFLPILTCKFYKEEKSVQMVVNIQFHRYVSIMLIIFLLFQISFLILTLELDSIMVIVLPYVVILYLFNQEVQYLKEKFNEIIGYQD